MPSACRSQAGSYPNKPPRVGLLVLPSRLLRSHGDYTSSPFCLRGSVHISIHIQGIQHPLTQGSDLLGQPWTTGTLSAPFLGVHVPSSDPPISPAGKVYVNKSQDLETEKTRQDPHVLPRLQLKMKSHTPSFGIHGQARASISLPPSTPPSFPSFSCC